MDWRDDPRQYADPPTPSVVGLDLEDSGHHDGSDTGGNQQHGQGPVQHVGPGLVFSEIGPNRRLPTGEAPNHDEATDEGSDAPDKEDDSEHGHGPTRRAWPLAERSGPRPTPRMAKTMCAREA